MKGYEIGNNAAVIKMATLHITGNIIDLKWFKHIKMENGKPDSLAILLLADVVYWYRPIEVRDEETGAVIGYRKKFAAHKLQRSYGAFAEAYGYTKDQVKDALKRLEDKKLIDLDFQHPTINGVKYGNLLYIGLNVDTLAKISTPLSTLNGTGYEDKKADPPTFKDDTNTEITPETSPETSPSVDENLSFLTSLYERNIGMVFNGNLADELQEYAAFPRDWIERAFKEMADANVRTWRYVRRCLDSWKQAGKITEKPNNNGNGFKHGQDEKPLMHPPSIEDTAQLIEQKNNGTFVPPPPGLRPAIVMKSLADRKGLRK
jgi:DNA replication protein DnaD